MDRAVMTQYDAIHAGHMTTSIVSRLLSLSANRVRSMVVTLHPDKREA